MSRITIRSEPEAPTLESMGKGTEIVKETVEMLSLGVFGIALLSAIYIIVVAGDPATQDYLIPLWSAPHAYSVIASCILYFYLYKNYGLTNTWILIGLFDGAYEIWQVPLYFLHLRVFSSATPVIVIIFITSLAITYWRKIQFNSHILPALISYSAAMFILTWGNLNTIYPAYGELIYESGFIILFSLIFSFRSKPTIQSSQSSTLKTF